MAKGIQTANGKAFEYACLLALYEKLHGRQPINIEETPQLHTARTLYESMELPMKHALDSAAYAAVRVMIRLEPQLSGCQVGGTESGEILLDFGEPEALTLSLQPDAAGIRGDVRDVLCTRMQSGWEIGLSCKHNHHAVKHSRLSDKIDFGMEWLQVPCSREYFDAVIPLFTELRTIRDQSRAAGRPVLWKEVEEKDTKYYRAILLAFMKELRRIDEAHKGRIPEAMIRYLLGRYDFYKVITDDHNRTTRVEAMNLSGTLNRAAGEQRAMVKVANLKMPRQFYHIDFKPGSNNTIEVVCDEGWQISMRIHNASSRVEPSLKFDVNLISVPSSVHAQVEPWDLEER